MMPIAPRYRRSAEPGGETARIPRPILTIPDWDAQETEPAEPGKVRSEIDAATGESGPNESELENGREKQPAGGKLRDAIHVYWSSATSQGGRLSLPRRLPEAIRGILPGIGISISLMFVWFLINRGSNEPSPSDLAEHGSSAVIEPITEDPLRKARSIPVASSVTSEPPAAKVASKPEKLFEEIPIIDRGNEASQQGARTEVAQAADPPRQSPARAGVDGATLAERPTESRPVAVDDTPPTKYEWSPGDSDRASQQLTVARRPTASEDRQPQPQTVEPQRRRQARPGRERVSPTSADDQQPNYSYQTTDPSTYKDPAYEVPPVARQNARNATGQRRSLDPQPTTRETPGRSRR